MNSNVSESPQTDLKTDSTDVALQAQSDPSKLSTDGIAPPLRINMDSWKLKKEEKPSFKRKAIIEAVKLSILFFILSPVCLFQLTRIRDNVEYPHFFTSLMIVI